jgi:DNA helicase-2/ATP-dependent DNA helicase PcrA
LLQTQRLFDEHPKVLDSWRQRFRYIMVDEFQDTNRVQYRLVRSLASGHGNLCVVGDDDQSIYSWRGAEVGNILGFEQDFPGCKTIRLEQNYRSSQTILAAAQAVVDRNATRKEKELWTDNPSGEKLTLETLSDDVEEARFIADEIVKLHQSGRKLRDIAVFYRTNAQSRVIEESLRSQNLPYVMFGGVKFYARKEVKDILSYLRLLVNPLDSVAAKRVINSPARGIGATTVGRIAEHEEEAGGFFAACSYAVERGLLPKAASGKVAKFVAMIDQFRQQLDSLPYPQLAAELIETIGYAEQLRVEKTDEARNRLENIEQLLVGMEETVGNMSSLQEYLEQVALITDLDSYDPSLDRVTLMTMHAAKGLEFPIVFMSGMEEGLFPNARSNATPTALEEERRLCYVGMTRAMDKLYLTHARRRRMFGSYQYNPPSLFLAEIPANMLDAVAPTPALQHTSEHNLASVFEQMGAESGIDESFVDDDIDNDVRMVPDAEEGLRIGLQVRHAKFGVGKIRRIEGQGDNQKVIVYFKTAGAKKLLLKFAGLEPA